MWRRASASLLRPALVAPKNHFLPWLRPKSSLSTILPLPNQDHHHSEKERSPSHNSIPDFNDSKAAFESKTTAELLRAAVSFRMCRSPLLVNYGKELESLSRRYLGERITKAALKATMYGHFCAGENATAIEPVLKRLDALGVGSILDYAAESDEETSHHTTESHENNVAREYSYLDEKKCDQHVEVFEKCIHDAARLSQDSFAAIKVTALGNPRLLGRMSLAINEVRRLFQKFDTNRDGFVSREEFEQSYK